MPGVEVDKELAASLMGAKKKPHNFAIVSKGPNVLHLIVRKKPIRDGELTKAKKEFQGNGITTGVVTAGDGAELIFQVAEEAAVGEVRLRKFITEIAGLTLKATFQVVLGLTPIDDVDTDEPGQATPRGDTATGESDPRVEWKAKLAEWSPAIKAAIAAKHPRVADIQKCLLEASGMANPGGDYVAALAQLKAAYNIAVGAASTQPTQKAGGQVNFAKSKLDWEAAKKAVGSQLDKLRDKILEEYPEEAKAVARLKLVIGRFNEGLGDTLDDLYTADDDGKRTAATTKAKTVAASYLAYVGSSELVSHVEEHPFEGVPVTVRALLGPPLRAIQAQLSN